MNKLVILGIVFILTSCAVSKSKITTPEIKEEKKNVVENKSFYDAILKKSDFDALKISSKINAQGIPGINATIYIENNQKIWMNVTAAMFFNIARGMATPQGVKMYEKIDQTYVDSDFSYLNEMLNVNFLDYYSLQNLLIGKVFYPINEKDFSFIKDSEGYILKTKESHKVVVKGKANEYFMEFQFSMNFDLNQVTLKDAKSDDQLQLFYSDWISMEENRFPGSVKIIIKGKKNKQILIENTKFEFSKIETPYKVPNNYKKRVF